MGASDDDDEEEDVGADVGRNAAESSTTWKKEGGIIGFTDK